MDIVLGVSTTRTTVRMVLVQGAKADGLSVENDAFDIATAGSAASGPSEQVSAAIQATQQSALDSGHHLVASGVTWSDPAEAVVLRESLTARGVEHVMLVPELHAAGALAQAIGEAVGYDSTALLFITPDTATLSVVKTADGSMVKVLSRRLDSADAMPVLTEIMTSRETQKSQAHGLFVVGSGVDAGSMKPQLENLVAMPVNVPEDPELALARGAALTAANTPSFEASTAGMAYSLDPDGATAVPAALSELADADTQLAPVGYAQTDATKGAVDSADARQGRKPFVPVGSVVTALLVIGVVAFVMSLAVSIQPTADQRSSPGENVILPSTLAPAPPPVQEAQPVSLAPAAPQPPPETIPEPVPVVMQAPQQAAPRTVFVQAPASKPRAPAPAAASPPPAEPPAALPAAPVDVPAASAPVLPPPAASAPVLPSPAAPPAPSPPPVILPILQQFLQLPFLPQPVDRRPPAQQAPTYPPQQQWPQAPPQQQTPQYPYQQWPQSPPRQLAPQYPSQQWPQAPAQQQTPQYPQYPSQQWPQSPPQQQYPPYPSGPGGYGSAGYGPGNSGSGRDGPRLDTRDPDDGSRSPLWPYPGN
ncbi:MAG: rane protein [Mycobacterium sp.]|nr:rane protein [Mycobacterium sp.]